MNTSNGETEVMRRAVKSWHANLALLVAVGGFVGAWAVIPYRLSTVETKVQSLAKNHENDHELLVRIEERLKDLVWRLDQKK